jgi:hypothetical protein
VSFVVRKSSVFSALPLCVIRLWPARPVSKIIGVLFALMAFVSAPGFHAAAQEHVDVPLPPYDPPPTVSHHSESHAVQPSRATSQNRSEHITHSANGRTHHSTRSYRRQTRRRSFHWPWEQRKVARSRR